MKLIYSLFQCFYRIEENDRMERERREQAKQQQKLQMQQMQRLSQAQSDNDAPQQPLFGVPKKVSQVLVLRLDSLQCGFSIHWHLDRERDCF